MSSKRILNLVLVAFLFWPCTQVSGQGVSQEKSSLMGAIAGQVINESGQPVVNVLVTLRSLGGSKTVRTTTTDAQGKFEIKGLAPEAYQVWAWQPSFFIATPEDSGSTLYRVGDQVTLRLIKGGVITGTVVSQTGEPVVAVPVRAYRIDDSGQRFRNLSGSFIRTTDDRGVYRIYGLPPGTYIVGAGGSDTSGPEYWVNPFANDAPTFAPSASRDTAGEVAVRSGEEVSGIDIRYQGDPGSSISGTATSAAPVVSGFSIELTRDFQGRSQPTAQSFQQPGSRGFLFSGLADGDYYLTARLLKPEGVEWLISDRRLVKVRGADIDGIELPVKSLGSLSGQIQLKETTAPECKDSIRPSFAETIVTGRRSQRIPNEDQSTVLSLTQLIVPDEHGGFILRNLTPGQYSFRIRTFAKYWYLDSMFLEAASGKVKKGEPERRPVDAVKNLTSVKSGSRISGLTITLAGGAGVIEGKIAPGKNEKTLPRKTFVYLVPAEADRVEDVLRYFVEGVSPDGSFTLSSLPPGRYWALAKTVPENEVPNVEALRLSSSAQLRKELRQQAEAGQADAILKPCQTLTLELPSASPKFTGVP